MLGIIKPSASSIAEETIPNWVSDNNPNFIAFVKYYYQWLAQDGNPIDLLQNMVEYRNVQETTPEYFKIISQEIMSFIPANSGVNANLIETKIRDFYLSKGTLPSYEFMINLLYGDTVTLEWNADKVFRPSSNASTRTGNIGIYSAAAWHPSLVSGSTLTQTYPTLATATINLSDTIVANNNIVNSLSIVPESIIGTFVVGGSVKVLSNLVNRSFTHISQYYDAVAYINGVLVLAVESEPTRTYPTLVVGQVGSTFSGIISAFINRNTVNNIMQLTLQLINVSGTFGTGKIYLITPAQVGKTYDDGDYFYGAVSPSITSIQFTSGGSLYDSSDRINYVGGSGTPFAVNITEVGGGAVETVEVVVSGSGYTVGDSLSALALESYGNGFSAIVSNIDGIGAHITCETALDGVQIISGGYQYSVGDQITLSGGITNSAYGPAHLRVSAISTILNTNNITISQSGYGYRYSNLALLDNVSNTLVSGFSANATITNSTISSVSNIVCPILTHSNVSVLINGSGATATVTPVGGVISTITLVTGGFNYIAPKIVLIYNPVYTPTFQASFKITMNASGTITGLSILSGGYGYGTTVTLQIIETYGTGAILVPIVTGTTGPITALTISSLGTYTSIPTAFNTPVITNSVLGNGLTVNTKYKIKDISLITSGQYYKSPTVDATYGIGSGAIIIPTVQDGIITSIAVHTPGANYLTAQVTIMGHGKNFTCNPIISGGQITSIIVNGGGYGYSIGDQIFITGTPIPTFTITPATFNTGANLVVSSNITNGVVTQMSMISGGMNYAYDTTISYVLDIADYPSYIPAVFQPVISKGALSAVKIISGGSGYQNTNNPSISLVSTDMLKEDGGNILLEDGVTKLAQDTNLNQLIISCGTPATMTFAKPSNGGVLSANILSAGTGYYAASEVVPILVTMISSSGSGAIIIPVISNHAIVSCDVISGGSGYTSTDTIIIKGGNGNSAIIKPVIQNGIVVQCMVISGGASYQYGTSAYVIGNGIGSSLICNVNTAITAIQVIAGGSGYTAATISIIDFDPLTSTYGPGIGATAQLVIDATSEAIDSVIMLSGGVGYLHPHITITSFTGSGAILTAMQPRNISVISVEHSGEGYTNGDVFIVGDGKDATVSVTLENNGSICNPSLVFGGSGYTATPELTVLDSSGYGAITGVTITNPGSLYTKPPVLSMTQKFNQGIQTTTPAEFICWGNNIGSITGVGFTEYGYGWETIPNILSPLNCIMEENVNFSIGENVTVGNYPYIIQDTSFKLLTEDGYSISENLSYNTLGNEDGSIMLCEDGTYIAVEEIHVLDQEFYSIGDNQIVSDNGPSGSIAEIDYSRRLIQVANVSNAFRLTTEDGNIIFSENGVSVVTQYSNAIEIGDILKGSSSKASASIRWLNRADGYAVQGAAGITQTIMTNKVGVLNDSYSKIQDGKRINDYAYVVRTGVALNDYKQILTDTIHPAGYVMYGDVVQSSFAVGNPIRVAFSNSGGNSIGGVAFSVTLGIKTAYAPYWSSPTHAQLAYYDEEKYSFYTSAPRSLANYSFDEFNTGSPSYLGEIIEPFEVEPYVSTRWDFTGATITSGSNTITGLTSTTGISIGDKVTAYDANHRSPFVTYDVNGRALSLDTVLNVHALTSNSITVSHTANANATLTVIVQLLPDVLAINALITSVNSVGNIHAVTVTIT